MSSAAGPSVLFTSNSSLESIEEYIEEEEEYVPLLTSHQHFVNNLESDIEEEEEEDTDTRSVRKNKRKPKTVQYHNLLILNTLFIQNYYIRPLLIYHQIMMPIFQNQSIFFFFFLRILF